MDRWIGGWMNGWVDGWVSGQIDVGHRMNGRKERRKEGRGNAAALLPIFAKTPEYYKDSKARREIRRRWPCPP